MRRGDRGYAGPIPQREGRRPYGSGTIYSGSDGYWHVRLTLEDGRKAARRRPTKALAEAAMEDLIRLHINELGYWAYRRYVVNDPIRRRPMAPRGASKRLRFTVLERDGYRCVYCGSAPADARLVVDHVRPLADGGTDSLDNLVTACDPCNAGKADRPLLNLPPGLADRLAASNTG